MDPTDEIAEELELEHRLRNQPYEYSAMEHFRYQVISKVKWPSKYIIYELMENMPASGTLREYKDRASALSAARTLTESEFDFVLRPLRCIGYKGRFYLVFPKVFTPLRYWLKTFNSDPDTVFTLFCQIGRAVQQLFIRRSKSFNDLMNAICITEGNQVFFCDEPGDTDFSGTILFLEAIATNMVARLNSLTGSDTTAIIEKFDGFLSFLNVEYTLWIATARFVRRVIDVFVLYHPIFWDEEVTVRFLGNLGRLGAESKLGGDCLGSNWAFERHIYRSKIGDWRRLVRNALHAPMLGRVLQFSYYREGDLALYVLNTMKHHWQHAKNARPPLPELTKRDVVIQLCSVLNGLVDILFEAYAHAVFTGQYYHPTLTPFDILTKDT